MRHKFYLPKSWFLLFFAIAALSSTAQVTKPYFTFNPDHLYEGIIPDLASGQLYLLWNTSTNNGFEKGQDVFVCNAIIRMNPVTENKEDIISLSQPLNLGNPKFSLMTFAGYGCGVVYTVENGKFYSIDFETGTVKDLGSNSGSVFLQYPEGKVDLGVVKKTGGQYTIEYADYANRKIMTRTIPSGHATVARTYQDAAKPDLPVFATWNLQRNSNINPPPLAPETDHYEASRVSAVTVDLGPDTIVCGTSYTLNAANPGSTYLWNTGAATQTINVTSTGIYSVLVNNPSGVCGSYNFDDTLTAPIDITATNVNYFAYIPVSGLAGTSLNAYTKIDRVCIDIIHTWDADLDIYLRSPTGAEIELSTDNGGSGDNYSGTCFSATAATAVTAGTAPFTGTFRPEGSFSAFDNQNPNGTWTLRILDDAGGDVGALNSWSISFIDSSDCIGGDDVIVYIAPPANANLGPDTVICNPQPVALNAGANPAGTTYLWNTGETTQSIVANSLGNYWVRVTAPPINVAGTSRFDSPNVPVGIIDNTTVTSDLAVSGLNVTTLTAQSINSVCIDITHTWDADLDIFLQAPNGTQLELTTDNGSSGDNYTNTCFSSTATSSITAGTAPFAGTFLPEGNFSTLTGGNANGTWTLRVGDDAGGDAGSLNAWWIIFNDSIPTSVCSASDTITISLSPDLNDVNLGPDAVVCQGQTKTLDAGPQNPGITYLWSTGATTRTIDVNTNGTYWARVTNQFGCTKNDTVVITVSPLPVVTFSLPFDSLYANSATQSLGGGSPAGGVFLGQGISGSSIVPTAFAQGNYTVTYRYTDQFGCISSATDVFTVIPKADKVNVLPNPSTDGRFVVVVSPDLIGASMTAYNQLGQKVGVWYIGGRYNQIKLALYPDIPASGRYILRIEKDGTIITKQLVITR